MSILCWTENNLIPGVEAWDGRCGKYAVARVRARGGAFWFRVSRAGAGDHVGSAPSADDAKQAAEGAWRDYLIEAGLTVRGEP